MRVVVFCLHALGHVIPTLPLVAELVGRGHEVTYYLNKTFGDRIEATGAVFRPLTNFPDGEYLPPKDNNIPAYIISGLDITDSTLPALVSALEADPPDVVVTDSLCPWGRIAADMAGVPVVSSMVLLTMDPLKMVLANLSRETLSFVIQSLPGMDRMRRRIKSFNHKYGIELPPLSTWLNWPADLNICYTSAEIHPDVAALSETYLFVGPNLDPRPHENEFPFDRLNSSRPLVYISLGSLFNNNAPFYRTVLEAFATEPVQVVLSTGDKVSPEDLGTIPENAIVRAWVPQLEVLQRAGLFVTHAGMGSVNEGLSLGTPLLMVPQQIEQEMVATRIAELGAGVKVKPSVSAESLRQTANHVLNTPSYQAAVSKLQAGLNAGGGAVAAADAIEAFANGKRLEKKTNSDVVDY